MFRLHTHHAVNTVENERLDDQEGDGNVGLKMNYEEEDFEDIK
jgi:hypothetical protein